MSTKASLKLSGFCLFMAFAMIVMSSVVIYCASKYNVDSSVTINFEQTKLVSNGITLNFVNNENSTVTIKNCAIVYNTANTQFKIVGPTPITSSSTSANSTSSKRSALENSEASNLRTATATPTGKISSLSELKNSSGAEFYYFCTNSSVKTNTSFGYIDPGTVYWTSTADTTLESWYDIPTKLELYTCFMKPNYTSGTDYSTAQIIISNSVTWIYSSAFCQSYNKYNTNLKNVAMPQSVTGLSHTTYDEEVTWGPFRNCTKLTSIILPNSLKYIGCFAFASSGLTWLLMQKP